MKDYLSNLYYLVSCYYFMIQCLILSEVDLELSTLLKMMLNSAPPASTSQVVGVQLCTTMHELVGVGSRSLASHRAG